MHIKELKEGDWFFDESAKLCCLTKVQKVEGAFTDGITYTYTDGYFETTCGCDTIVFPLTIENKTISDKIRDYYSKFNKEGILYPKTSRSLQLYAEMLMCLDPKKDDYNSLKNSVYDKIDDYMKDLIHHMSYFK